MFGRQRDVWLAGVLGGVVPFEILKVPLWRITESG
jgi:hypothetical protein